jgi:hypothetical protein
VSEPRSGFCVDLASVPPSILDVQGKLRDY